MVPVFRVGRESFINTQREENDASRTLSPPIRTERMYSHKRVRHGSEQHGIFSPVSYQRGEQSPESMRATFRNVPGMPLPRQPVAGSTCVRPIGRELWRDGMTTPAEGGGNIINSMFAQIAAQDEEQDGVVEAGNVDWEHHLQAACAQSKMSGSCKIYGWSVEDEEGTRLYKFSDPRIKLQAIGLWHR